MGAAASLRHASILVYQGMQIMIRIVLSALISWSLLTAAVLASDAPVTSPDWVGQGYEHYVQGDIDAKTPAPVAPGFALMGGGKWPLESFRWFVQKAGGGHIVVLRASYGAELQNEIYRDVGGMVSIETLVIHERDASKDPRVLDVIRRADGIFIGGG